MEEEMIKIKKVLVFGVFDMLHDGHRFFLKEAATYGDSLTIVVARNKSVLLHKGKQPRQTEELRKQTLELSVPYATVVLGDETPGSFQILEQEQPSIIALGYDQDALRDALLDYYRDRKYAPEIVLITGHREDELHTSLLH